MAFTRVIVVIIVWLGCSMINNCLPMVIPSTTTIIDNHVSNITTTATLPTTIINDTKINQTATPTHILRVRIRVHNSLIETLADQKQLDLIEVHLQQRHITYRQIQDNKDGITIIIGPFHKSKNLTATMMIFNQSRFHKNFTKMIPIKPSIIDKKNEKNTTIQIDEKKIQSEHFPITVEAHEYNLTHDQESYEFRNCLEACEIYEGSELKPNHNCIRKNCLKEITGI
ncbi:unnamed protein product [Rotaria sp. Silwood1]|nr:unnamed protein product [Rotaria sp. Silwood1]CAF3339601.1 unnamed protein product [Rotaria sp. Silwood1]CAF3808850.1 unnamed protein product [Rotaria sp. Silwood1]CAF3897482.1 unnamed protein product [Rotaria sp. Silwood1]CAF4862551.1 unnamed protein product [Rotaria sp. Silwood1]